MALAGFELTNDFGDPAAEARACREDCALFDFSFLEHARLQGPRARSVVETFAGRSLQALAEKQICYALRLDAGGKALADLTIWRTGAQAFDVMSGCCEDVATLLVHAGPGVEITDMTPERATFAVQGPRALDALLKLGDVDAIGRLEYFSFGHADLAGIPCTVGRLGYTGEAGFEIIVARRRARDLWRALSGHLRPAGFIAADMLRIEAGFVLFTNEFGLPVSPAEAGLARFHQGGNPPKRAIKLVSFRADGGDWSWPWRPARALQRPERPGVIAVTSACDSVVAGGVLGLGYVLAATPADTPLQDPAGVFRNIRLTPMPFYDTAKRRPRAPWR
jgi:glycine cleavage system T protein (aminomethyltransferase)